MRRSGIWFSLAVCFLLGLPAQEARRKTELMKTYNEGLLRLGQSQPDEAIALYKKVIAADPTFWQAYDKLVLAYGQLHQLEAAQDYLEQLGAAPESNPYAYYGLGLVYQQKRDFHRAVACYKKCIEWGAQSTGLYGRFAETYRALKKSEEAIAYLEEKVKSNPENSYAHYGLGYMHYLQDSGPEALRHLDAAIKLTPDLIEAYHYRGRIYLNTGRYKDALKDFEKLRELAEHENDLENTARATNSMGTVYRNQGNYEQALAHYQKSLAMSRQLGDRAAEGSILTNLGNVYKNQGRYAQALEYYQKSLAMSRQLEDAAGEGTTLNNMGNVYQSQGHYGQALECYQKSLAIRRRLHDLRGEGGVLGNLAIIYGNQGDHEQALEYHKKCLAISQQVGDRAIEGRTLTNIGNIYRRQGHYGQALAYYQKSLAIKRQLGDRPGEGLTLNNIGIAYREQGNYTKALEHYQKSLAISRQAGDRAEQARALSNIGFVQMYLGSYERAVEYLDEALKIAKDINLMETIWISHDGLARVWEKRQPPKVDQALAHYKSAVEMIKKIRSEWRQPQQKIGFLENKIESYERLCGLLARLDHQPAGVGKGYDREAFHYAEEAKARTLVELLQESKASPPITEGLDADLLEKESNLQLQLSDVQARLEKEKRTSEIRTLEKRKDELYHEYENLIGELRQRNPRYAHLNYPEAVTVEQCQRQLDEETVLLEYLLGEESSLLFAISKGSYEVIRLSGRKSIEERAHKLRKTFTLDGTVNTSLQLRYVAEAAALYDLLIKPAEKLLKGKKRIVIAPDGALYYVPFPALLTKKVFSAGKVDFKSLPYLIKSYSVSYVPSASVWSLLAEPKKGRPERQKKLLAFGDPDYEKKAPVAASPVARLRSAEDSLLRGAYDERGGSWKRLLYSGEEVRQIARLYAEEEVRLFLRAAATEENVKKSPLWEYERIHFAAHSVANESKPQFSGIILTTEEGSGEDGYLQMYEIFKLRLNARLVVLSGCETGLGQQTKGEGMIGLMRAFMYAGAESIVASLWKIEDRSTSEFMRTFYTGLEKSAPAQALQSAQLELINRSRYSHPYFWSTFALYGRQ